MMNTAIVSMKATAAPWSSAFNGRGNRRSGDG